MNPTRFIVKWLIFFALVVTFVDRCSVATKPTQLTLPTPQPTPPYIVALSPEPSETIPFTLFLSGESQKIGMPGFNLDGQPAVCVQYNLTSFNHFSISYTTLLIDGFSPTLTGMIVYESNLNRCGLDFGVCRDRNLCWQAPFGIGIHEVVFQLHLKSSEVEEYTWYYEIIESSGTATSQPDN